MSRKRVTYRPQLERLEDWFAPNNLFALFDVGLGEFSDRLTWAQPEPSRPSTPVLSEDTARSFGADGPLIGTRSSHFDSQVSVPTLSEHPRTLLVMPGDDRYLLNLPLDGSSGRSVLGPGSAGDCPAIAWNSWSGPPEDNHALFYSQVSPVRSIVPDPWSLITTSVDVAAPSHPEYPYVQGVDWTGWTDTTTYCDHITEYYSPGVYAYRANPFTPPDNELYFWALQARDAAPNGGPGPAQQKPIGRQVKINEGAAHVFIASDSWGLHPNTRMNIQAIAQERGIPFSVADNIQNFKTQIDAQWRANGMRPIDVFLAGGGALPGGDVSIGAQFMWFRFANWDHDRHIEELGLNPNSAKGKVRSLTIFANYLTRDYQPGMDHHAIKLLAQALDDGMTVNPRVGGWTGVVFAVRPGANRPGHFTSTEGSSFNSVLAR